MILSNRSPPTPKGHNLQRYYQKSLLPMLQVPITTLRDDCTNARHDQMIVRRVWTTPMISLSAIKRLFHTIRYSYHYHMALSWDKDVRAASFMSLTSQNQRCSGVKADHVRCQPMDIVQCSVMNTSSIVEQSEEGLQNPCVEELPGPVSLYFIKVHSHLPLMWRCDVQLLQH